MTLLDTKNTPFEATIAGLRLRGSESAATVSRPPSSAVLGKGDPRQRRGSEQQGGSLESAAPRNPDVTHDRHLCAPAACRRRFPARSRRTARYGAAAGLWKAGARMPEKEIPGRASNGKFWTRDGGRSVDFDAAATVKDLGETTAVAQATIHRCQGNHPELACHLQNHSCGEFRSHK